MKYTPKPAKYKMKSPSYATEFSFVTVSLFLGKLYNSEVFMALSFFTICIPIMLYLVISLFGNLLKFIQMMHIEDEKASTDETSLFGILSAKQGKLLVKVIKNLMGYFGLYFLTAQLDNYIMATD